MHNAEVVHLAQILFGWHRIVEVNTALRFTLVWPFYNLFYVLVSVESLNFSDLILCLYIHQPCWQNANEVTTCILKVNLVESKEFWWHTAKFFCSICIVYIGLCPFSRLFSDLHFFPLIEQHCWAYHMVDTEQNIRLLWVRGRKEWKIAFSNIRQGESGDRP